MNKTYTSTLSIPSYFVNIFPISCSLEPQGFLLEQNVIIRTIFDVGLKHPSIDWVPPTMGALHNNIKIVRVDVQPVLRSIVTDHITESLFNFGSDGVFTCVHVCDVGVFQPLGKFCPRFVRDVVCLTNVDAPYSVLGRLEHTEKMHHLIISHGFIEILQSC